MMKIHSVIQSPTIPAPTAPRCPGPAFAGQPCTFVELSAKGPSLGAIHRAGFQSGFIGFRAWRSRADVCTLHSVPLHRMPVDNFYPVMC